MAKESRTAYPARFKPSDYAQLFKEADKRGVSMRQVLDDAIAIYFKTKGTPLWQKILSSGLN